MSWFAPVPSFDNGGVAARFAWECAGATDAWSIASSVPRLRLCATSLHSWRNFALCWNRLAPSHGFCSKYERNGAYCMQCSADESGGGGRRPSIAPEPLACCLLKSIREAVGWVER